MKLGLVIYSTEAEVLWNGFRLGVFALKAGDQAKAFLLANKVVSIQGRKRIRIQTNHSVRRVAF